MHQFQRELVFLFNVEKYPTKVLFSSIVVKSCKGMDDQIWLLIWVKVDITADKRPQSRPLRLEVRYFLKKSSLECLNRKFLHFNNRI